METFDKDQIMKYGLEAVDIEMQGLKELREQIGPSFIGLVGLTEVVLKDGGKIVLTGVGKNVFICQKIAATLCSTGSKAAFLDATAAMHGDLGMLSKRDIILAVSYSGETEELLRALPAMKSIAADIIAITGNCGSRLSKEAMLTVPMKVSREACPFNLAPTTSTTALLALGDALAMALMKRRKFALEDYAKLHPSGAIGRTLTLKAKDIMHVYDPAPVAEPSWECREAMMRMLKANAPAAFIVGQASSKVTGLVTGKQLASLLEHGQELTKLSDVAEPCKVYSPSTLAADIVRDWNAKKFEYAAVVGDDGVLAGVVEANDLGKFKV